MKSELSEMSILVDKVDVLCKCDTTRKKREYRLRPHRREVQEDGWTRLTCEDCGQVKFQRIRKTAY